MTQSTDAQQAQTGDAMSGLARAGKVSYMQIPAIDAERSAAFYQDVFGWTVRGDANHRSFTDTTGELIGAWITGRAISAEPGILPYIYVDGIDVPVPRRRSLDRHVPRSCRERDRRLAVRSALA